MLKITNYPTNGNQTEMIYYLMSIRRAIMKKKTSAGKGVKEREYLCPAAGKVDGAAATESSTDTLQ